MNYIQTPTRDKQTIRIGFEKVNTRKRNIYNHTEIIGYAERTSICWWKGYLPDGTFVKGDYSLERIGLEILATQERM